MAYPKQMATYANTPQAYLPPSTLGEALSLFTPHELIVKYIQDNPASVKERGFNGITPLHKAVLSATPATLELLLQNGADPNSTNNFGETPMHFACRGNNPQVAHVLSQHGGDVTHLDNMGKSCLHHAAQGGNVYLLHYLWSLNLLDFQTTDNRGCSALQIACEFCHADAVHYLLRYERVDIFHKDAQGNTALHIAALKGFNAICWKLMEIGGARLMLDLNHAGYSALDLAKQGEQIAHQQVSKMMTPYYHMVKASSTPPRIKGPTLVWYWHLVAPIFVYTMALLLTNVLPLRGFVMLAGFFGTAFLCKGQMHRMKHICGIMLISSFQSILEKKYIKIHWPNPMHAGLFAGGILHTILCYFIVLFPVLSVGHSMLHGVVILLVFLMFYLYYKLLMQDPGIQHQPWQKESGQFYTMHDVVTQQIPFNAFCTACEIVVPPKTKHCKICQKCFSDMDHHCLFLYCCIAGKNHRVFVRFIILVIIGMTLFEHFSIEYLKLMFIDMKDASASQIISLTFQNYPWIWSMMVGNLLSVIWLVCLLRAQIHVISRGHTSYFTFSSKTQLSFLQRYFNVINFIILGRKFYAVETEKGVQIL